MKNRKVVIIAECGVNHNGCFLRAKEMVDVACKAGADFVKFQVFKTDALVTEEAPMATYQENNLSTNESQHEMLKKYELSHKEFKDLFDYVKEKNIGFLATPFDSESLHFLDKLGVESIKISSGDLTNTPFLIELIRLNKNIILSTGMATTEEVFAALCALKWGLIHKEDHPQSTAEVLSLGDDKNFTLLNSRVTLLHCTSDYPASPSTLNLNAMKTLSSSYGLPVGYSDHSAGIHIPAAAVALDATVIEKHFTLDKLLPGPDHKASISPEELKEMVSNIRDIELSLGTGIKEPVEEERETAKIVRKGVYIKKPLNEGELITLDHLKILRPESAISPANLWDYLDNPAKKTYVTGDPL